MVSVWFSRVQENEKHEAHCQKRDEEHQKERHRREDKAEEKRNVEGGNARAQGREFSGRSDVFWHGYLGGADLGGENH